LECNHQYAPGSDGFSCPNCKSEKVKVISGEEFYMEAIDVDT